MERRIAQRIVSAGLLLSFGLVLSTQGAGTKFVTLFDASQNHMLTTKLSLNSSAQLTSYEVMAPDSFFQRVVVAKRDGSSRRSVDSAYNFDERPIAVGSYTYSGSSVNYKFVDDERATISATYPETSSNGVYSFTNHKNMNIRSLRYTGDQIEALDASGQVAFKAFISDVVVPTQQGLGVRSSAMAQQLVVQPSGRIDFNFSMPQSGVVQLKVFDIAGRLIQSLAAGTYAAGSHTLHAQLQTHLLASGMLVVQGRMGSQSIARKVLLTGRSSSGGALGASVSMGESVGALSAQSTVANEQLVTPGMFLELLFMNKDLNNDDFPRYLRTAEMQFSSDRSLLYMVQEGAKRIAFFDPLTRQTTATIALPNEPTGMALNSDGSTMYVTCSSEQWPSGIVYEIDVASKSIRGKIAVGHSARSPVVSPDDKKLYTCNIFEDSVAVVDLSTKKVLRKVNLVREPYAAAITPDGKTLVVTNNLPVGSAVSDPGDTVGSVVSLIDLQTFARTNVRLMDGAHTSPDVLVDKNGKYAFLTVLVGKHRNPANEVKEGWIQTNNLVVIDIVAQRVLNSVPFDLSIGAAANPWGMAFNEDESRLCVAHAGSNEISFVYVDQMLAAMKKGVDLTTLIASKDYMRRKETAMKNPRSVAMANDNIYSAGYLSDSLGMTYVKQLEANYEGIGFGLGGPSIVTPERRGEIGFYDAKECVNQWQSCSSCHPFTRPDMLNWDLGKDGWANPRNCKSMLWSHRTDPPHSSWSDETRARASDAVGSGFINEQKVKNADLSELVAVVDTFLNRLKPYPSPYLVKGKLSEQAARGRALYNDANKVNCIKCHARWTYTDKSTPKIRSYNTNTGYDEVSNTREWDVPTLAETWRTAPFLHDGRSPTLEHLLKAFTVHSNASSLATDDFNALVEYVNSL